MVKTLRKLQIAAPTNTVTYTKKSVLYYILLILLWTVWSYEQNVHTIMKREQVTHQILHILRKYIYNIYFVEV